MLTKYYLLFVALQMGKLIFCMYSMVEPSELTCLKYHHSSH